MVIWKSIGILAMLCVVIAVVDSIYCNRHLVMTQYELDHVIQKQNSEKMKFVFLTDLHGCSYGKENERLIEAIRLQNPDGILIGGDMLVKQPEPDFSVALALVKKLLQIAPVYYSNGNHEKKVMDYWEESKELFQQYKRELESMGVQYLLNESRIIFHKGRQIEIVGLDLDRKHFQKCWHEPTLTVEELKEMLPARQKGTDYRILLAHNPQYFSLYDKVDVDLVLSGHVHGGIMILPVLGGVLAPDFRIFPKYDFGKFDGEHATMLLSRGLGVHRIKFRIFNYPEVLVFEI